MRRFNIFQSSHSAIRSQLLDTSLMIQFTDFSHPEQVKQTFDQIIELILACQRQAEEESKHIIPAIHHFNHKIGDCFAASENDCSSATMILLRRMNLFEKKSSVTKVNKLAVEIINKSFRRFSDLVIRGMQKQEEVLNPLLWSYYSDEQLRQLLQQIEGKQTITEWLSLCTWMMKDMSDEEIVSWLISVRSTLPEQVYDLLVEQISGRMPLLRWENVQTFMTEEAMVA
jgi:hypothetical protein